MTRAQKQRIAKFNKEVLESYRSAGRSFPWRGEKDPYKVFVSEIMLQQTGVERVEPYYLSFLKKFPDFASLAAARSRDILAAWQGLGYNRRALYLQRAARVVREDFNGRLPDKNEELRILPGVGPGTAGAVLAYAFGIAMPFVETNIRKAIIHFFYPRREKVRDEDILKVIADAMDRKNPRQWYYAVVDYGVKLRKEGKVKNSRSAHWKKQSIFEGSNRQLRARILREIIEHSSLTPRSLERRLKSDRVAIQRNLDALSAEGFLEKNGAAYKAV